MIAYPRTFVVYDLETTGLDVTLDQPIEIAAIRFVDGVEESRASWLVKPESPISPKITEITGLTNEYLEEHGRPLKDCLLEFTWFIKDLPVVGHNISRYDNPLIEKYEEVPKFEDWIDTAGLFKASQLFGEAQRYNETHKEFAIRVLSRIVSVKYNLLLAYKTLGGEEGKFEAHRAMGDCEMTAFVYRKMCLLTDIERIQEAIDEVHCFRDTRFVFPSV